MSKIQHLTKLFLSVFITSSINAHAASLTIADLPSSSVEDNLTCFDKTSGELGQCDEALYNGKKDRIAWVTEDGTGDYSNPIDAMNDVNNWCSIPTSRSHCLLRIGPGSYYLSNPPLTISSSVTS